MAQMNLSDPEIDQLAQILDCEKEEVADGLQAFSDAATEEYVRMILGQRVFTRGQDVREYRLYLLIRHVFDGRLPSEQQISDLFQTTTTQSRALLRAVMSKYQYELHDAISATLNAALDDAEHDAETDTWSITVDSENVIDALNRRLASIDGTLPQIVRSRNTITTYEVKNSAYEKLMEG